MAAIVSIGKRYGRAVTSRSGRGRWQRVVEARQQARAALGRDPHQTDLFEAPPKAAKPPVLPDPPPYTPDPYAVVELVLSRGEAASKLGISRDELDAMIASGKVEAQETGFTWMIPTREVKRLLGG
jgi:excisionase family DNA binding protein